MAGPGDAISVSLDEIHARIRALTVGQAEFPVPDEVARTIGPAGGASREFRAELVRAARQLAFTVDVIAKELADLETEMAAAATEFNETDGVVAKDVNSLEWMLDSADQAAGTGSNQPPSSSGDTSTDDDATVGVG